MPAARKRRRAAPRWEPTVNPVVFMPPVQGEEPEDEMEARAPHVQIMKRPVAPEPPAAPAPAAAQDEWADKKPTRSANLVMLWLLLPFVTVILWQLLFDGAYE